MQTLLKPMTSSLPRLRELTDELNSDERELSRFFDISPDLFSIVRSDGVLKRANRAWTDTLGWTIDEIHYIGLLNLVHPDDEDNTRYALGTLTKSGSVQFRNRYKTKSGVYICLEWNSTKWLEGLTYSVARPVPDGCRGCVESRPLTPIAGINGHASSA